LAWDDKNKNFLAQCIVVNEDTSNRISVLRSANGSSWSVVDSHLAPPGGFDLWASPLLEATQQTSATMPLLKDDAGNIVPNGGLYGWDGAGIMMAPRSPTTYFPGNPFGFDNTIKIVKQKINPGGGVAIVSSSKTLPMDIVCGVAYSGGTWYAGGYDGESESSVIVQSSDDGETWKQVESQTNDAVYCITGA
jgi:hypothetical protein